MQVDSRPFNSRPFTRPSPREAGYPSAAAPARRRWQPDAAFGLRSAPCLSARNRGASASALEPRPTRRARRRRALAATRPSALTPSENRTASGDGGCRDPCSPWSHTCSREHAGSAALQSAGSDRYCRGARYGRKAQRLKQHGNEKCCSLFDTSGFELHNELMEGLAIVICDEALQTKLHSRPIHLCTPIFASSRSNAPGCKYQGDPAGSCLAHSSSA